MQKDLKSYIRFCYITVNPNILADKILQRFAQINSILNNNA